MREASVLATKKTLIKVDRTVPRKATGKGAGASPTRSRPATSKRPARKTDEGGALEAGKAAEASERPAPPASERAGGKAAKPSAPVSHKSKKRLGQLTAELAKTSRPNVTGSPEARERALAAASAGLDKKASNVEIIDVAGKVDYADYLVLMSGTSDRHVASLVQNIEQELAKKKHKALSVEGMPQASWVLIDFADVVVHVFQEEARGLYDLGAQYLDARRVPLPERVAGEKS